MTDPDTDRSASPANPVHSRLYVGKVMHARFLPAAHRFVYPIYAYALDLDELPALDRTVRGFAYNRFAFGAVHDKDYLDGQGAIRERLMGRLAKHGCADGIERIVLVTMARFLGYAFNPVSFYYCLRADGALRCAVAEVNNTFGERHLYILEKPRGAPGRYPAVYHQPKQFHVSPFNDTRGYYELSFSELAERMRISVTLYREDAKILTAVIHGKARPLDTAHFRGIALRYPLTAASSVPRISWQAAQLFWRRKLRFHHKPNPTHPMTIGRIPPTRLQNVCMRRVRRMLERMRVGRLHVALPDGTNWEFTGPEPGRTAAFSVRNYAFFTRTALAGDIGFGEAYTAGDWDCEQPAELLGLLIDNLSALGPTDGPAARALGLINRVRHLLRRNTRAGSRRNVRAHYDLGNAFYRLFLDEQTMTYSCAMFSDAEQDLADAQRAKIRRVAALAQIDEQDHVLEIGCGWGGFAVETARRTGCRVTGITVSEAQCRLARERVADAGLAARVNVRLTDYRDVQGAFDKIVSIEMIEAVGHAYLPAFFAACERVLKPGGRMVLQAIVIPDERYEAYRRNPDWIQKHIFPGGMLPSLDILRKAAHASARLRITEVQDIGSHYVPTLRHWRRAFNAHSKELAEMGFDEAFRRKWDYYFSYCEAGFAAEYIRDVHLVLQRPQSS